MCGTSGETPPTPISSGSEYRLASSVSTSSATYDMCLLLLRLNESATRAPRPGATKCNRGAYTTSVEHRKKCRERSRPKCFKPASAHAGQPAGERAGPFKSITASRRAVPAGQADTPVARKKSGASARNRKNPASRLLRRVGSLHLRQSSFTL
ncbi:transcriptional regulator, Crp/Fnr family domain protein [Burkholderia pseudomallei MSHR7498]|nr:transcriptional regulator, Crp/Fnr family domain protein [Burkholderia pseudomallei MSHR7498]